ncbi:DNA mismatch repair protein MutS [Aggregicoccus sp. 17bor-14]|nr:MULTISPECIES: DNA mismatch repair protein MutS [Myxococcaceae]MBF5042656.1 DNA mismatch repair protein MutS [Simulacricoccus sp. 17bor-14]MRI88424.1 DNA mismatch repair protein MutS [Aggregicoccus sp. 17bor-14]
MSPSDPTSPHAVYTARLAAAKEQLARLDRLSARFANARALAFVADAACAVLVLLERLPKRGGWAAAAALLVGYGVLAALHHRVFLREERARRLVALNERGLARLSGAWHAFAERGERFLSPAHLYAPDLDVFGQGSLFQLLNETATRAGEARLAAWLSGPAPAAEVAERQGAVRELAPLLPFRQELCVEAHAVARDKADPGRFIAWAEGSSELGPLRWAPPVALVLPLLTLLAFVLGRLGVLPPGLWWAGLLLQLGVVLLTRGRLGAAAQALSEGERDFMRYAPLFARVEAQAFTHPALRRLQEGLGADGGPPVSHRLARFSRVYALVEMRHNQFHPLFNLLTLVDVHALFALERWRTHHGRQVRGWFEALAQLEALGCLAGLAHDRPGFSFPEVQEGEARAVARGLGHPLLEAPVLNDVSLPSPRHALLVTGSNMSGKTTLLRALGANTVLALAGAPVCAGALELTSMQVLTSMRVKDSLERGVSYFYAEVQRLKSVLDAAQAAGGRALFLLDEILLGTNTRERQLASREVLRLLLATGAIGGVTTHDLSLTALADEPGSHVVNVHFRDHLEQGQMVFDYRLREGVVDTTNALRVLRMAGIPVPESAEREG